MCHFTMEMAPDSVLFGRESVAFVLSNSRNFVGRDVFTLQRRFARDLFVSGHSKASHSHHSDDDIPDPHWPKGPHNLGLLLNFSCCSCYPTIPGPLVKGLLVIIRSKATVFALPRS